MLLETIDLLRCTADHEDSPLVASVGTRDDREIISGVLGCPICHAEYPIEAGIAIFGSGRATATRTERDPYEEADDEAAMRCAAMLNLFDPGGTAVLGGRWARAATALAELTRAALVIINPAEGIRFHGGISGVRIGARLPFAPRSMRGIALDGAMDDAALIASAVHSLKPGGRLIASTAIPLPSGIVERARDDRHWVAEVGAATSAPIQLAKSRAP